MKKAFAVILVKFYMFNNIYVACMHRCMNNHIDEILGFARIWGMYVRLLLFEHGFSLLHLSYFLMFFCCVKLIIVYSLFFFNRFLTVIGYLSLVVFFFRKRWIQFVPFVPMKKFC